jgi:hypothetical protein
LVLVHLRHTETTLPLKTMEQRTIFAGIAVKTTMEAAQTVQYTALISGLTKEVRTTIYFTEIV